MIRSVKQLLLKHGVKGCIVCDGDETVYECMRCGKKQIVVQTATGYFVTNCEDEDCDGNET